MHKLIIIFLIIALTLLTSCTKQNGDQEFMSNADPIPEEVNQLDTLSDLSLQTKLPFYNAGTMRIWMEIENTSEENIQFQDYYYLEVKNDSGWETPMIDSRKDFAKLDAGGVQFPIESGEIREIGVYIGALGIYDEDYASYRIPCGVYRLTMVSDTQSKLIGEFEISNEEPVDERAYSIKTVSSSYDKDVKEITYEVINESKNELYYGVAFHIEQYVNDKWKVYTMTKDIGFNDIAIISPPNSTTEDTITLTDYYTLPMKKGRYRLVKQLDRYQNSYAEFTID